MVIIIVNVIATLPIASVSATAPKVVRFDCDFLINFIELNHQVINLVLQSGHRGIFLWWR